MRVGVEPEQRVVAHPASADPCQLFCQQVAFRHRRVQARGGRLRIFQERQVVVSVCAVVLTSDDDLQRDAAHTREGQQRVVHLLHAALHLFHLPPALRTGDGKEQQPCECFRMVEALLAEGGREDEVGQLVGVGEVIMRQPLRHFQP